MKTFHVDKNTFSNLNVVSKKHINVTYFLKNILNSTLVQNQDLSDDFPSKEFKKQHIKFGVSHRHCRLLDIIIKLANMQIPPIQWWYFITIVFQFKTRIYTNIALYVL